MNWRRVRGQRHSPTFNEMMCKVLADNVKARTVDCPNPSCGKPIDVTFDEEEGLANGKHVRCQACKGKIWVSTTKHHPPIHYPKAVYVRL